MATTTLECQGLPCPQPVIQCKNAIEAESPDTIVATVDNEAAKENVTRFLATQGYDASAERNGSDFVITGTRKDNADSACEECEVMSGDQLEAVGKQKILIFIPSDVMGNGDDELGAKLIYNFLLTLKEMGSDLWRVVLVNSGVKLATEGNKCAEELKKLEESGVSVLVCGTCLEHFSLTDKKTAGDVTNMLDIITSFQLASKTIRV